MRSAETVTLRITTDPSELDIGFIHRFLAEESYWARGIPLSIVRRSIEHSLCFGGFVGQEQIAFARVVSDYATFANLVDVFVVPQQRGRGYSKMLLTAVTDHPSLQGIRRFMLTTADAHGLYAQFGFTPLGKPANFMERYDPAIYSR